MYMIWSKVCVQTSIASIYDIHSKESPLFLPHQIGRTTSLLTYIWEHCHIETRNSLH